MNSAVMADLDEVSQLFNNYRLFYQQESDLERAREYLAERIGNQDSVIYIARSDGGEAVGFTQLYPTFSSQSMQNSWILNDLYVHEAYRRMGVAQALVKKAAAYSEETGAKGLMLCTQHTNAAAQKLYAKMGFTELSEFKWYFLST